MTYYCGNNELSPILQDNGGDDLLGTHDACFKKGYARGINQTPADVSRFVQNWTSGYRPHIVQRMWHSDETMPPGYQRATLSQSMQRGFAFGSMALAERTSWLRVSSLVTVSMKKGSLK